MTVKEMAVVEPLLHRAYICTYIYTYQYVCAWVCVCMYACIRMTLISSWWHSVALWSIYWVLFYGFNFKVFEYSRLWI